jgi:hypothetical protein
LPDKKSVMINDNMNGKNIFRNAVLILALAVLPSATMAAPAKSNGIAATNAVPQAVPSVFVRPTNPSQGRDPFFPNSKRPYENGSAAQKPANDISALTIKGFVGTGNVRSAVINNHAFRAGEEGDVLTPGGRMHIRCIMVKEDSVIIEVDSERHELKFRDNL